MAVRKFPPIDDLLTSVVGVGPRDTTCAICTEDLEETSTNLVHTGLPHFDGCQRAFCVTCIQAWCADRKANNAAVTCPVCRAVLSPDPQQDNPDHGDFLVTHAEVSPVNGSTHERTGLINWGLDDQNHAYHGCIHWSKVYFEVLRHARLQESQQVFAERCEQIRQAIANEGRAIEERLWDFAHTHGVRLPKGEHDIPIITIDQRRYPLAPTATLMRNTFTAKARVDSLLIFHERVALDKAMLENLRRRATIPRPVMSQLREYVNADVQRSRPYLEREYWMRVHYRGFGGPFIITDVDVRQGDPTGRLTRPVYHWSDSSDSMWRSIF